MISCKWRGSCVTRVSKVELRLPVRGAVESPVESRQRVCLCVYETVSAWRACERMGYMAANTQLAGTA